MQQWSVIHDTELMRIYSRIPGRVLAQERWFAERDDADVELNLKTTAQFRASQNTPLYLTLNLYELSTLPGFFYYLPLLISTEHGEGQTAYWRDGGLNFYDGIPTTEYLTLVGQLLECPQQVDAMTGCGQFKFQTTPGFKTPRFQSNNSSSNSLLFVYQQYLLKNYRRIFPGINPELRLGLALTEARLNCVPAVWGYFSFRFDDTCEYTLGLVQELVEHQGTGWAVWGRLLEDCTADQQAELMRQAEMLGQVLAELHREMANIAAGTNHNVEFNASMLQARVARLTAAVDRELDAVSVDVARRVRDQLNQISAGIDATAGLGRMFRIHGDLHLEQVLKTASGWKVIDFEGEPLKSIVEREDYDSPLKDVASMLRSISYRVNSLAGTTAAEWESRLQTALVNGYCAGYRDYQGDFLPEGGNFERLLELFQLERVIYELSYESKYRPGWLHIPLDGLAKLVGG